MKVVFDCQPDVGGLAGRYQLPELRGNFSDVATGILGIERYAQDLCIQDPGNSDIAFDDSRAKSLNTDLNHDSLVLCMVRKGIQVFIRKTVQRKVIGELHQIEIESCRSIHDLHSGHRAVRTPVVHSDGPSECIAADPQFRIGAHYKSRFMRVLNVLAGVLFAISRNVSIPIL